MTKSKQNETTDSSYGGSRPRQSAALRGSPGRYAFRGIVNVSAKILSGSSFRSLLTTDSCYGGIRLRQYTRRTSVGILLPTLDSHEKRSLYRNDQYTGSHGRRNKIAGESQYCRCGAGHNAQFADYWSAGRFSAPRGETLLLFPPRHSKTFMANKRVRGTAGIGSGCESHSARTRHNTTCFKQGYKTSARRLPLESLARGCSGSRFFCVPGHAVQGRNSRAPSPARPSFDPDHVLHFVISLHFRQVDSPSTTGK
jgi:hypothetical protein